MEKGKPKKTRGEWILLSVGVAILACGTVMSFQDKTASATATYGAGILCLIFSSLSMFQSFKGLGVEAVLKDKIEEADKLINHLKSYILPTSELLISNIATSGRWGSSLKRREKYELFAKLSQSMRDVGISEEEIEGSKKYWHRLNIFDMSDPVAKGFDVIIKPKIDELQSQSRSIPQPINADDQIKLREIMDKMSDLKRYQKGFHDLRQEEDLYSLDTKIRSYLQEGDVFDGSEVEEFLTDHQESLKDIEYYKTNKDFRRPAVWFSGERT